ncbi:hypothetical protein A2V56_00545 [Candidatus Woesebacteria bacterium RBG_19FT_COMBO_42_9]|uniref:peptidylprolyl isomerase n=1 Tax=Candidatus Woesebacteria bacterium RBG_16_42_24 TaxID=1802485 RepID=A0A1F7XK43_9BACT|nr:MAG: hypothetical protein A2V97_00085 [Candidatus Woesebacteria bacterium RBG_16_42_24]OGM17483.1 MAG: hypothetical protein A2V56_00545 [Candidatus Woesebacteria bacterium RBG_19FT_COMBO_42_9]OGM67117.1 MAG: hypothetical protein A2985_02605 [Candidatus Woesebacteria bacterium RIFCSPLOWO2_01_FULL_43_11]
MKIKQLRIKLLSKLKSFNRKKIILIAALIAAISLGYLGKGLFVAALVNGMPISRLTVVKELEKQGGSQTLDNLVVKSLIFQEAKKKGVEVSQSEIDSELSRLEQIVSEQGMTLDEALSLQNQSKKDLLEQIKIQKTVEKILSDKIVVSDEEVKDYFEKNGDLYEDGTKLEDVADDIKNQLAQTKLSSAYQSWITELKAGASINYFVTF